MRLCPRVLMGTQTPCPPGQAARRGGQDPRLRGGCSRGTRAEGTELHPVQQALRCASSPPVC